MSVGGVSLLGRLALALGSFVLTLAVLELSLTLISIFVTRGHDRSVETAAPGNRFRILCVGDSNTYGLYVEKDEAYPAQLERSLAMLETEQPVEVINLGVPGINSAQVLNRLSTYVEQYEPDLVIVLVGVTDHWNQSEMDSIQMADEGAGEARSWIWRSRVARMVLLAVENLASKESTSVIHAQEPVPRSQVTEGGRPGDDALWQGPTKRTPAIGAERHEQRLRRNLGLIVTFMDTTGIPLVLPTYIPDIWHYAVANRVIREIEGSTVIPSSFDRVLSLRAPALAKRPTKEIFFQPSQHPTPQLYRLFAEHLRDEMVERGIIPVAR